MKHNVRAMLGVCALFTLIVAPNAQAQTESASESGPTIELPQLIERVAKKTGRKFLVDPRVRGRAPLVGFDPASVDYPGLLSVLQVHGFATVEDGDYVRVIPDANVRQQPLPLVTGNQKHPDGEYVSLIIPVKNMPAPQLVPVLRPLLPQSAHLVAIACSNVLLVVDSFGNARRIEKLVQAIDTGEKYQPAKCGAEPVPAKPST